MIATNMSAKKRKAILLVAQGLAAVEVAKRVGGALRTIMYWKADPEFAAAVEAAMRPWLDKIRARDVADRDKRLERLNADRLRLMTIRDERANDPRVQDVPGGKTGLVYRSGKTKNGINGIETTEEFRVDYRMLAELREIEEQAARELGQRIDKHLHIRSFRDFTDEDLDALIAAGAAEFGEDAGA
jgi:hypothetical protein